MTVILVFLLGCAVGSFLNVLSDRLPKGQQVILGRSRCDHCQKKLKARHLIPILSYFFLLGRCAYCRKTVSLKYPLVEFTTGLGFVCIFNSYKNFALPSPPLITIVFLWFLFSCLLVIFLSDWQYLIIPNKVVLPAIFVVFLYQFIFLPSEIVTYTISGFAAFLFLYLLFAVSKGRWMGLGDAKYAFLMGQILGFPAVIIAFYLSFLTGAGVCIILLLIGKVRLGEQIPFGPFLVLATLGTLLWKEKLLITFLKLLF